jgi:hypothetical protein
MESGAAAKALDVAQRIQQLMYYEDGFGLPAKTKVIFDRCYRALRKVVELHYGEDHPLFYAPLPGRPFQKKA